ncbi:methionyl-tRNA formyltransferase [Breznakia sp. OttesenSCG-928-G09]|nr:methionyl-tRNA formyltransferase [Breznakia sp. OttesenSCG-928-G09]
MKQLRIIFMGTPDFACSILESLIKSEYEVVGVVSQPDKKVGRKQIIQKTPVKQLAEKYHLPVFQPLKIKEDYKDILALNPDLIVTCAYGQMIPEHILNAPVYGSLNVHASLLPKLRGGAPIHKAIITGEKKTGVSIMRMVKKMDAGDYMLQKEIPIDELDTTGTLHDKLMKVGAEAIMEAIPLLISGKAVFVKQDETKATFAYNISKEEEKIDLDKSYKDVYNHIRGLIPWPVGYIDFYGKKLKLHAVRLSTITSSQAIGKVFVMDKKLCLACHGGVLELLEVQLEGKKKCSDKEFINGNKNKLTGGD